ncbi:MAG: hypothetical protein JRN24_01600 [Nitrososphaerota archaeon]|nr:hypothetical protein [Nitrososphaerota archaeon]
MRVSVNMRRNAKKSVPFVVVAAVLFVIGISMLSSSTQVQVRASLQVYFPSPMSYTPGVEQPNALLTINYTGPGTGDYYFLVTYNSSSGTQIASRGAVALASGTSSSIFLQIPIGSSGTVVTHATVFKGVDASGTAVYSDNLVL